MNAQQWRGHGYKTVFRRGKIYLYRPQTGIIIYTDVNFGKWMNFDNVNEPPWVKTDIHKVDGLLHIELNLIASACYCDMGVDICDFCSGIRRLIDDNHGNQK